ncbi:MarR family winged helix-turn-helix transcriptional regulator [Tomitella gaofuii]|uniref:MarR family winged helix-turn-helix transcriptional regulator n=1 Tax=Tomitella gaofuii TaxID=2760083 RepID=UPI001F30E866|nr:MarR family transcriptional regulator [Tomitella gaofuii]
MTRQLSEWSIGRLLMTASRLMQHAWEQLLREHGVSHAGFIILESLRDGPLPQRGVARYCRVTDQTISRSIERLERHGLVTRATDPHDERRQLVTITERGRELHTRITERVESDPLIAGAIKDPEQFRASLLELIASLEEKYAQR